MFSRYYYSNTINEFLNDKNVLQTLTKNSVFDITLEQRYAWDKEIYTLKENLKSYNRGSVIFEYDIPRLGKRVDVLLLIDGLVFVLEYKAGADSFTRSAIEQVWDYALDLKNFHEASHNRIIVPILVATEASNYSTNWNISIYNDNVLEPLCTNSENLKNLIDMILSSIGSKSSDMLGDNDENWIFARYSPTPTIIQAASYMYNNHNVENITKSDASGESLKSTTNTILEIINRTKENKEKAICFVTGVPGAGKTLVGLNTAIQQFDKTQDGDNQMAVYLSGNGPLVDVLTEALARDKVLQEKNKGNKILKKAAQTEVKSFIQNIHHYRNDYLAILKDNGKELVIVDGKLQVDEDKYKKLDGSKFEGVENVAIFDEAQRAWTKEQLASWLSRKKGIQDFPYSEPEFLIWSLDLRKDWAVIVCLVGGGQEINTGEAGITEWLKAVNGVFKDWMVYISPNLTDKEYDEGRVKETIENNTNVNVDENLHLAVSNRSFRAETLSNVIHDLLDLSEEEARNEYANIKNKYPIYLTRNLDEAKKWLKKQRRAESERYGILCSSQAYRLKPLAIDVRVNPDTVHWFLEDENDIRSSLFMEDVCTEFQVQGLELDWTCVVWDGDFRYDPKGWINREFLSTSWRNINKLERQMYQKNAYRVLLTRARQGMVICVPEGNLEDQTRLPEFYDSTYNYLKRIGFDDLKID